MRGRVGLIGLVLLSALAAPLAGQRRCCIEGLGLGQVAATDMVFPRPPDSARIRYEGWLHSDRDFGRKGSIFGAIGRVLVGGKNDAVSTIARPYDVYALGERVYVSNGMSGGIVVFDGTRKQFEIIGTSGPGQLIKPMGLGGDGTGRVYVADQSADRVVVFGPDGEFETALGGPSVLLNPVDVAADRERDRIYVADSNLHQVVVFNSAGEVVARLGSDAEDILEKRERLAEYRMRANVVEAAGADSAGTHPQSKYLPEPSDLTGNRSGAPGEFKFPSHVAVAADGTLYVTDSMNFRIQVFDSDGNFVRAFGTLGDVPGTFSRPKGVGVDQEGHIYVADAAFSNLQIFDPEGRLLLIFGSMGAGDGQLWSPLGVHIDGDWIYVADRYNDRIQIFRFLGGG